VDSSVLQNAQGSRRRQGMSFGFRAPVGIIDQQQGGLEFLGEGNRFSFSGSYLRKLPGIEHLAGLTHLKPCRGMRHPGANKVRRAGVLEVCQDSRRKGDLLIEGGQNGLVLDQHEVMEGRGIRDDEHSEAKPTMGLPILFQVIQRIPQWDIMIFEKRVDFQAGVIAQ
jgi:hypothetical protein